MREKGKDYLLIKIVVINYNGEKYIQDCLRSILKSDYPSFELVVVDDGSTDNSIFLAKKVLGRRGKLIELRSNRGTGAARNHGATAEKGDLLFFLDVDTQLDKDCLQMINEAFKKNSKLGACQAKLISGKTGKIETVGHFLSPFGFPYEIRNPEKLEDNKIFGGRSAALAVRCNVFGKIGGFDEDYLIYGEDTDLCWRIWLSGYEVRYLPEAKVIHWSKSSMNKDGSKRVFYEGAKNNTSNILKNANLVTVLWILPLHLFGWVVVSAKLVIQGRLKEAIAVYSGLDWNLTHWRVVMRKRRKNLSSFRMDRLKSSIVFGKTRVDYLFAKGINWLMRL